MSLTRRVSVETLDHLAEDDPRAIRSRRDLQRVNRIMGTCGTFLDAMQQAASPRRIIELGAGDGTLMLRLAKSLHRQWPAAHLTLLDRQSLVHGDTLRAFDKLGWEVELLNADILDWATHAPDAHWDLALCNLFLHHFDHTQLPQLLDAIAQRCTGFFACEPRRAWLPLAGSYLIGVLGVNQVTREDAVLSVKAGFDGAEISACWPKASWRIKEYPAGLFSHCFHAMRDTA